MVGKLAHGVLRTREVLVHELQVDEVEFLGVLDL